MKNAVKVIVHDYGWIHLSLGLLGNTMFFIGSVAFLPRFEQFKIFGVWLFIVGSFLMLVGSLGEFLVDRREKG